MLGAATTLGVAWGVAYRGCANNSPFTFNTESVRAFRHPEGRQLVLSWPHSEGWGWTRLAMTTTWPGASAEGDRFLNRPAFAQLPLLPSEIHPPQAPNNLGYEYQFGWPVRAMWAASDAQSNTDLGCPLVYIPLHLKSVWTNVPITAANDWIEPFETHTDPGVPAFRAVPTGVLAAGFAWDTAIFASLWGAALSLPGLARKIHAKRGHRCQSCGYSLDGLTAAKCPECGRTRPEPPTALEPNTPEQPTQV